jgi:bifunctional UDP-N-acetylglucosamine pyrophosphorylase / glucosamine-1-phosphate N-acetyltransferase
VSLATIILAAGLGTRMRSKMAKVLHPVGGVPMVIRAVNTAVALNAEQTVLVVGHGSETVRAEVNAKFGQRAEFVEQGELLGTGHAVMQAADAARGKTDRVAVYYADMPLLRPETLHNLVEEHTKQNATVALLTVIADDPRGFGRIVRDVSGNVTAIVEEKEATPEQLRIRELNVGVYVFDSAWLWSNIAKLKPSPVKGEYYLTDMVQLAVEQGGKVIGIETYDRDEVIGINTRVHLAEADTALRRRVLRDLMESGVSIIDPASTYIHEGVQIGQDTVILPNTHIFGATVIGENCVIGPNTLIRDSKIGADCVVEASFVEEATMENEVHIGPFAHLRAKAYLETGVHMGNFGEVKNSRLGAGTRMGHFSYIGDAQIGVDVNIGAGTITVNYDGVKKHKTIVGDHAFIGSDSMLIAPLTVANNARTAAGSVVTKNVPEGHIAIGVPARMRQIKPKEQSEALVKETHDPQPGSNG